MNEETNERMSEEMKERLNGKLAVHRETRQGLQKSLPRDIIRLGDTHLAGG